MEGSRGCLLPCPVWLNTGTVPGWTVMMLRCVGFGGTAVAPGQQILKQMTDVSVNLRP